MRSGLVAATLMQNQPGGVAVTARLERELGIDSLMEETPLGHWECAQRALARALNIQPTVPRRHFEQSARPGEDAQIPIRHRIKIVVMRNRVTVTKTVRHCDDGIVHSEGSKNASANQALVVRVASANSKRVPE